MQSSAGTNYTNLLSWWWLKCTCLFTCP